MDIGRIDRSATQGHSWLHRCSSSVKLGAFALVLVAVVVSVNVLVLGGVLIVLIAATVGARLPLRLALGLALYPGIFAAIYALGVGAAPATAALIVVKAITAALAAVIMVLTTPYPQIFAPIQRWLPEVIADGLLMTYRSFFLLIERFSHVVTAARLRAGIVGHNPLRSAGVVTRSLGSVLLYSIDLSQRTYDVMHLRGYDGRLVVAPARSAGGWPAIALLACAASVAIIAVVWRIGASALAPFAWIPVLLGMALLAIATVARLRPEERP